MIIYGTRGSHLRTAQVKNSTCSECGSEGALSMSIFGKYFHIFWIPLFPYSKTGVSQCQNCKATKEVKEMPDDQKSMYRELKKQTKSKKRHFSGLVIIGLLIAYGAYASSEDAKLEQQYLAQPQVGDVYSYKSDQDYSTMKVTNVEQDSLEVDINDYTISKSSATYKIDKPENYSGMRIKMAKSKVKEMYTSKEIIDIKRASVNN